MQPPCPGFVRVVIACRYCGAEDVLDLHHATPERLRSVWRRCSNCRSDDIEIAVTDADGNSH